MTTKPRLTKAEQKRQRIEAARIALARAQRRQRTIRLALVAAAAVVVIAAIVVAVVALRRPTTPTPTAGSTATATSAAPTAVPGRTSAPPWPTPTNTAELVAAAGLPMLGEEGSALHIHAHLDVIVDGKPVGVPAAIGIDESTQQISPLHTHDTTGIIHVESPTQAQFTLGQFFTEWQVSLSPTNIGGLTADPTHLLRAYVNGQPYTGNPTGIVLKAHDEIALVYGTADQQTNPPASYTFPPGD
jgi:hypothetical protein